MVPEYYIEVAPGRFLESNRMYFLDTKNESKSTWIVITRDGKCWYWCAKVAFPGSIDCCVEISKRRALELIDLYAETQNLY